MNGFRYVTAPLSLKLVLSMFLIMVSIGYVVGLTNIYLKTNMSYTGVVSHYRGNPEEMKFPKSLGDLVQEQHVHIFGISMIFVLSGIVFAFTSLPEKVKAFFVVLPFASMLFDLGSFWLLRFVNASFGWLSIFSGGTMAVSFFLIVGRPLYEMWIQSKRSAISNQPSAKT